MSAEKVVDVFLATPTENFRWCENSSQGGVGGSGCQGASNPLVSIAGRWSLHQGEVVAMRVDAKDAKRKQLQEC